MTVVPRPMNGSYTTSPGAVNRSMKKRGSCGLKHARYETSWRLCAARCLLVQNSLTSVSTTIGRDFARPTLVTARAVWPAVPLERAQFADDLGVSRRIR